MKGKGRHGAWIAGLLILLLSFGLCGCENSSTRSTEIRYLIGVSMADLNTPWRTLLKQSLTEYAGQYPDVRLIVMDAAGDSEKQENDIERLQNYGIDLLIVSPTDVEKMTGVVSEVYKKIPVIVMDRSVEGFDYTQYIGADNELISRQAADQALAYIGKSTKDRGVLELITDNYVDWERREYFLDRTFSEGLKVVDLMLTEATRDCAEDTLLKNPNRLEGIKVIFAHNDAVGYGAKRALEKLGREDIKIIGVDGFEGEEGGLTLVENGEINATVICPTGGQEAIDNALNILRKKEGVPKKIILRSTLVNEETLPAYQKQEEKRQEKAAEWTKDTKIRLGFVQIDEDSGFRLANTKSLIEAAENAGIELELALTDTTLEAQCEQIRAFIREGVDVIGISPVVENGWDEVLQEAKEAGIPVILSDRMMNVGPESYEAFIGGDFEEEGKSCARWLEETCTGNAIRIFELEGTEGSTPANDRRTGFDEEITKDGRFEIVHRACGDFRREEGERIIQEALAENGCDFDVIYAHNDDMAIGAIDALTENGLEPGKDVLLLSVDGTEEALKRLQEGQMNCVAECSPLLGENMMNAVKTLMEGGEIPMRIITNEMVFTQNTPAVFFQDRKY